MKPWLLLLALLTGTAALAQTDSTAAPLFTAEEVRSDLDSLYSALRENHPDLYAHWPKPDADAAFAALRAGVTTPQRRTSLYRLIMPFIARFRDGHTFLDVDFDSPELARYEASGGRYFPLRVRIINGRVYSRDTLAGTRTLYPGDELLHINGRPAGSIAKELIDGWPADGPEYARVSVERLFGYVLWLMYGWGNDTRLLVQQGSKKNTVVVPGVSREAMLAGLFHKGVNCSMQLQPDLSLAVVTINAYKEVQKTKAFIDSCFRVIRTEGIRHVALDLRRNGGGNSAIGAYFIAHLSRTPYSVVRSKSWRLGPLVTALPEQHWMRASIRNNEQTYNRSGQYLHSPAFASEAPAPLPDTTLFVPSRFYLLTSTVTYSSAHMTALAVKCGGLGTIIGQPTGERLDLTGEILEYTLPATKLKIVIPAAMYRTACGNGADVGVQPDVPVPLRIADLRAGRDAELEALRELLRRQ
ncbi:S41 family peptidase [Flaviaesturariibacter amylovorans]